MEPEEHQALKDKENNLRENYEGALLLKDYAINANLDLPDSIIDRLNKIQPNTLEKSAADIDKSLRDLINITYPTTLETLRASESKNRPARLVSYLLLAFGFLCLIAALVMVLRDNNTAFNRSVIATCLGALGSLVYTYFNFIGVIAEKAFSKDDVYSLWVRLELGAIVGWVFYYTLAQNAGTSGNSSALMLLPFAAGYSTRLVVGLINQAIGAIELTIGLQDKTSSLLKRRAHLTKPAKAPSPRGS